MQQEETHWGDWQDEELSDDGDSDEESDSDNALMPRTKEMSEIRDAVAGEALKTGGFALQLFLQRVQAQQPQFKVNACAQWVSLSLLSVLSPRTHYSFFVSFTSLLHLVTVQYDMLVHDDRRLRACAWMTPRQQSRAAECGKVLGIDATFWRMAVDFCVYTVSVRDR